MDSRLKESYNREIKQVMFERSNINKESWHKFPMPVKNAEIWLRDGNSLDMRMRLYKYKPYSLWCFLWWVSRIIRKILTPIRASIKHIKRASWELSIGVAIFIIGYAIVKFWLKWI